MYSVEKVTLSALKSAYFSSAEELKRLTISEGKHLLAFDFLIFTPAKLGGCLDH